MVRVVPTYTVKVFDEEGIFGPSSGTCCIKVQAKSSDESF